MNLAPLLKEVRQLIAASKTDQALTQLTAHLESSLGPERAWLNTALQLRAEFQRIRQQKLQGVTDPDDLQRSFNQVDLRLLELLSSLERAELPLPAEQPAAPPASASPTRPAWVWPAVGGLAALLLGVLVWLWLAPAGGVMPAVDPPDAPAGEACPVFDPSSLFNVMVLPFQPLRGEALNVHAAIKDRLALESEKYRLPTSVKVKAFDFAAGNYPSTGSDAAQVGQPCGAQLIIWGSTEAIREGDEIVLTRFRFLNLGENFAFTKLKITEALEIDTLTSLSSIATDGLLTQDIEQNIKLLFGIIAHETNQDGLAVQLLEATTTSGDSSASLLRGMALADSYLALNQHDQALKAYDGVLEQHPNYSLARNNRAGLYLQQGEYEAAAIDLATVLENNPDDVPTRLVQTSAYLKANRVEKAAANLELITPDRTTSSQLNALRLELKTRQAEQLREKTAAERILRQDPTNMQALQRVATAASNLGEYRQAVSAAQQILDKQPANPLAIATLVEAHQALKDTAAAQQIIDRVEQMPAATQAPIRRLPGIRSALESRNN